MAVIIFMSQLEQFKTMVNGERLVIRNPLFIMLGLVLLTIAIVIFPKITKAVPFISSDCVVFDWF
jgi:SulP family sulfate permease